jgi:Rrf2 family protein
MKISKKAYYGLRAVIALGRLSEPASIRSIAETEHLPEDYLEKILQALRRVGIVEAKKGADGGYSLARPAREISVWDILKELDSPLRSFSTPIKGTLPCLQPGHCQTNEVWRILEKEIEKTLSSISIDDLLPKDARQKHAF